MPILDANLLIRANAGEEHATQTLRRLAGLPLIVPAQAALEFLVGVDDIDRALHDLQRAFEVQLPSLVDMRIAAQLGRAGRAQNVRVQSGDAWIAAHAKARADYVVSTNKRHFARLGVACWNYEKEDGPPVV